MTPKIFQLLNPFAKININVRLSGQLNVKCLGKKEIMCVYVCIGIITYLCLLLYSSELLTEKMH